MTAGRRSGQPAGAAAKLGEVDRDAVADGRVSLAELAASHGVSREAVRKTFKRRGWLTTPTSAASTAPARPSHSTTGKSNRARKGIAAKVDSTPAPSTSPKVDDTPLPSTFGIVAALPVASALPFETLQDHAHIAFIETGLALLGKLHTMAISPDRLGAQQLKASVAALQGVHDLLRQRGVFTDDRQQTPVVQFEILDAEAEAKLRNQAERSSAGYVDDDVVDDDDGDRSESAGDKDADSGGSQPISEPVATDPAMPTSDAADASLAPALPATPAENLDDLTLRSKLHAFGKKHGRQGLVTAAVSMGARPAVSTEKLVDQLVELAARSADDRRRVRAAIAA